MKRSRSAKLKKIYLFNILLLTSIFFFQEVRTNFFVRELSQWQLQRLFPRGTVVKIGNIEGGIFSNLVSENISILPPEEIWQDAPGFNIERVEVDYRLWYPLFGKMPTLPDSEKAHLHIAQGKGSIIAEIERENDKFTINGQINHLKIDGMDFIGEYSATVDTGDKGSLNTRVAFKNIIINYAPFSKDIEVTTSYNRIKGVLGIDDFKIGKEIKGHGHVGLTSPYAMLLKWTITDLSLEDYFTAENNNDNISGKINGNFVLEGPAREAALLAHMDVQNGDFNGFTFDSAMGDLKGKGPLISIFDSRIRTEDTRFIFGGEIDLTKLKDNKAFDGLFLEVDESAYGQNESSAIGEHSDSTRKILIEKL
ncbi:MAG: hypothetical protein HQ549_07120 [Candidatus Omnitrophica bacterium]|nr:hypothetical protein [Candidatus Omnitrophota bacterium]